MILACQNISKAFGTTEIIKNASFHIEEREKAALIGNNGAGKTCEKTKQCNQYSKGAAGILRGIFAAVFAFQER